jgi:hypothetical protein
VLEEFLRKELLTIPMVHWSHYFPAQVAVLRFLQARYAGRVELASAGFDSEGPYVRGKGIAWFADVLWEKEDVIQLVDRIMTDVVLDLKRQPPSELDTPSDVTLDPSVIAKLERRIVEEADAAIREGLL